MLLWRSRHAYVYAYASTRQRRGKPALGVALKVDGRAVGRRGWRHAQIGVYGTGRKRGRGCWTMEATTWRTALEERGRRDTLKAFVRVKVGLGGEQ